MKDLVDLSIRLGQVDTTVLIQGESGWAKRSSPKPFTVTAAKRQTLISINCAAILKAFESELFGYVPGPLPEQKDGKAGISRSLIRAPCF